MLALSCMSVTAILSVHYLGCVTLLRHSNSPRNAYLLHVADMGNSVDRGCADAVLRCVANAQPALRHAVNCKVKAGECAGCTLEGLLAKHGFHFDTALKELDSVKLLELVRAGCMLNTVEP